MENLNKAFQMAEGRQLTSLIQEASGGIGDVFLQTDRPLEALPHYRKAIDSIESTRSLLESEELRTSFFENKGQIYGGIISAHLEAKNVEEAFNYNERARSRAFLDILGNKVQLTNRGPLLEEERALQAKISLLKARTRAGADAGDKGGAEPSSQELEAAQNAYNDFLTKVRKENKEEASLMNVEPLTLKETQQLLEPGVTMLEYFVTDQNVLLWVVEKDRVQFVKIPLARKDLVSKVTTLRFMPSLTRTIR
jgi:tetratricopeptide (TPR) repeat protein